MTYGVTATGFVKKTLSIIRDEIEEELLDLISSELDLQDVGPFGQIIGIFSDKLRELWDVQQAVYRAFYPDSASDEALDQIASLTGVTRLPATKSTVTLDQIFLEDGVTVTAGSVVSVGPNGPRFVTLVAVTNSSGRTATFSVAAQSEDYGPIQGYAETIDTIQTAIPGWSAAAAVSGDVQETFSLDGTSLNLKVDLEASPQIIAFSGGDPWSAADAASEIVSQTTGVDAYDDGDGYVRIASTTEGEGSAIEIISGAARPLLGLPIGLVKGFNSEDADPGRDIETDPELRVRRDSALRSTGSATVEAIYSALILVDDVEQVFVVENVFSIPANGLPPKSFEAIVYGGTDQDIADKIWEEKPAGILAYGSETVVVTDSMGFDHDIHFSRPTEIPLYLDYTLTVDPALYPADGDDQVKAAVIAFAAQLEIGEDAIALQFEAVPLDVAGVIDVTAFKIDTSSPPSGTSNIVASFRELFTVDTADVDVTS